MKIVYTLSNHVYISIMSVFFFFLIVTLEIGGQQCPEKVIKCIINAENSSKSLIFAKNRKKKGRSHNMVLETHFIA